MAARFAPSLVVLAVLGLGACNSILGNSEYHLTPADDDASGAGGNATNDGGGKSGSSGSAGAQRGGRGGADAADGGEGGVPAAGEEGGAAGEAGAGGEPSCIEDATRDCYDGPEGTRANAPCHPGTQICQLDESGTRTVWGPCSGEVTPAAHDSCGETDDETCNGTPHEGCDCVNGEHLGCSATEMGCTLAAQTCADGTYGTCQATSCHDFTVPDPTTMCTCASNTVCENTCSVSVCPAGYYVTACTSTPPNGAVTCAVQGADPADTTKERLFIHKGQGPTGAGCSLSACLCRRDGF